jgi:hypothetical protein
MITSTKLKQTLEGMLQEDPFYRFDLDKCIASIGIVPQSGA